MAIADCRGEFDRYLLSLIRVLQPLFRKNGTT